MALTVAEIHDLSDDALLARICQESAEVIQAVTKHQLFGPFPYFEGVQYDNVRDTNAEFRQVTQLMTEYRNRFGVPVSKESGK